MYYAKSDRPLELYKMKIISLDVILVWRGKTDRPKPLEMSIGLRGNRN
jgi:hypothetical protein